MHDYTPPQGFPYRDKDRLASYWEPALLVTVLEIGRGYPQRFFDMKQLFCQK